MSLNTPLILLLALSACGSRDRPCSPDDAPILAIGEGGVNDLRGRCGTERGPEIVDELVSEDGARGEVAALVDRALDDGARVVLVGYHPMPEHAKFKFDACNPELQSLRGRYAALADARHDVVFVDPAQVVDPERTPQAYEQDGVHPSPDGSERIGRLVADALEGLQAG